jgi:hypothetical protein
VYIAQTTLVCSRMHDPDAITNGGFVGGMMLLSFHMFRNVYEPTRQVSSRYLVDVNPVIKLLYVGLCVEQPAEEGSARADDHISLV